MKSSSAVRVIRSTQTNPFYNLAFEGHLMSTLEKQPSNRQRTLFLWQNEPTVVIGKHQNPYLECNLAYMEEHGVHLTRRHSGGGAVYQDLGNSIFTFLSNKNIFSKPNNFQIIKNAMQKLGFSVDVSGRNDMTIFVPDLSLDKDAVNVNSGFIPGCDLKISGSAFKAMQNAELHHGTLLVDVDMDQMTTILTPSQLKLESKGIKSVRSRVINLKNVPDLLQRAIDTYGEGVLLRKNPTSGQYEETSVSLTRGNFVDKVDHSVICDTLQSSFVEYYDTPSVDYLLSDELMTEELAEKIAILENPEWRFGASPQFFTSIQHKFPFALVDLHFTKISSGVFNDVKIFTDSLLIDWVPILEVALQGCKFSRSAILEAGQKAASQLPSEEERNICQQVCELICDRFHL